MQRDDTIDGGFTSGEYEILTPNYQGYSAEMGATSPGRV